MAVLRVSGERIRPCTVYGYLAGRRVDRRSRISLSWLEYVGCGPLKGCFVGIFFFFFFFSRVWKEASKGEGYTRGIFFVVFFVAVVHLRLNERKRSVTFLSRVIRGARFCRDSN